MKKTFKILIIAFLMIIYIYVCKINSIPNNIILYNNDNLNFEKFFGLSFKAQDNDYNTILTSTNINEMQKKIKTIQIKLFNTFTVKEVSVNVIDETTVIPVGQISGLKLYTSSSLIVGMSEIKGEDNKKHKPYLNSGLQEGDRIIKINEKEILNTDDLINIVNNSNGEALNIEYVRDNNISSCKITPIKTLDGNYKLGLWVRDSAAGIGTLTFYEPSTREFCCTWTWNYRHRYRRFNTNL